MCREDWSVGQHLRWSRTTILHSNVNDNERLKRSKWMSHVTSWMFIALQLNRKPNQLCWLRQAFSYDNKQMKERNGKSRQRSGRYCQRVRDKVKKREKDQVNVRVQSGWLWTVVTQKVGRHRTALGECEQQYPCVWTGAPSSTFPASGIEARWTVVFTRLGSWLRLTFFIIFLFPISPATGLVNVFDTEATGCPNPLARPLNLLKWILKVYACFFFCFF